jgi:carbon-monoxide dehydrogenase small subunit
MFQALAKTIIEVEVNGAKKSMMVRPADTLLFAIREQLGLTGAKDACGNGDCDACTVLVDGRPIKSCLMLAVEAAGHKIITIEGLRDTPVQKAFLDKSALQCGYCTPGFILNSHALVTLHPEADEGMIKEWLQSNLCRCTGYQEIRESVKSVLQQHS